MSLPPGFIDELRSRLSLGQVVGRKVMWDSRKSNQGKGDLWAPCPFHQEKSASFHVDDRKGFYYCFGCHAKGDAFNFVQETENVGFMEAVEILAREAGIALVLDETYRDFHSADGPPHGLFADPGWADTLIHLYSFSKAYRLTGHRVGALLASPARLAQVEKFLDTVTICPPQLGQHAALWGMEHLQDWLAAERREVLARKRAMVTGLNRLKGWRCLGAGAYFAYVEHPYDIPSPELAKLLVEKAHVLVLPGTMFRAPGDPAGLRELRFAFANADAAGLDTLMGRLAALG